MNFKEAIRNPIMFGVLSVLTLGLFSVLFMIYMIIRLKTYKFFLIRPVLGAFGVFLIFFPIFEFTGLLEISRLLLAIVITSLFIVQWIGIPMKLEEKREFAGILGDISWKLGMVPIIVLFYNFGYIFVHIRNSNASSFTLSIGLLLIFLSLQLAIGYWVWKVAEKFKDYLENRGIKAEERVVEREVRKRQRNLMQTIQPEIPEDLPMFELSDFEVNKQADEDLSLKFDDDSDLS